MLKPYIGVTGFVIPAEVKHALSVFEGMLGWKIDSHDLMVGVLVSSHTLVGERGKFEVRYPKVKEIQKILSPHRRVINLVHYATHDPQTLGQQLTDIVQLSGNYLDGFQLNMVWPDPARLKVIRGMRVVLQLGSVAIKSLDFDPEKIAERLDRYDGIITDVLIDRSGGRGRAINVEETVGLAEAVNARHPELLFGVAGGLSRETLKSLIPMKEKFGCNFSVDAEGKLRNEWDRLKWDDMTDYLRGCVNLFKYI